MSVQIVVDSGLVSHSCHDRRMTTPALTSLIPAGGTIGSHRAAYDHRRPPVGDRPWIGVCMIASLDGSTSLDGTSGGLGNANDVAVLGALRSLADMILVGASTAEREHYRPPKKPGQTIAVATNRGRLDLDRELYTSGRAIVIAPESADIDDTRVTVVRAGAETVDLAAAVVELRRRDPAIGYIQAEGGPRLNGGLAAADLIDEIDLTISPHTVGGPGDRIVAGAGEARQGFRLAQLLADDEGFLFGRWLRDR